MSRPSAFSRVPPEIWNEIFQTAVAIPSLMDVDPPDTFDAFTTFTASEPWDQVAVICNRRLRRSLIYVCKSWYAVAIPFLFEYIILSPNHAPMLSSLCTLLKSDPDVGSRVRHIIIADDHWIYYGSERIFFATSHPGPIYVDMQTSQGVLSRIFRCTPRAESITIALQGLGRASERTPLFAALLSTNLSFVRKLHFIPGSLFYGNVHDVSPLIRSAPRLRAVTYGNTMLQCAGSLPRLPELSFLTITNRTCFCDPQKPSYSEAFPSVTKLLVKVALSVHDIPMHVLHIQGARITTVFIECSQEFLLPQVDALIAIIHSRLPNVTRLHLVLPRWTPSIFPLNIPSSVTHLSLKVPDRDMECEGGLHLFALFFGLAASTQGSALKVVRFLSPTISTAMRNGVRYSDRKMMDQVLHAMTSDSAFHIEDWRGRRHMPAWMEEGKLVFS